jgi:hypothetical protein
VDGYTGYGRTEANLGSSAREVLTSAGIKVEMRSPDTPVQLGVRKELDLLLLQLPESSASILAYPRLWLMSWFALQLDSSTSLQQRLLDGIRYRKWSLASSQTSHNSISLEAMDSCLTSISLKETRWRSAPLKDFSLDMILPTSIKSGYLLQIVIRVRDVQFIDECQA